MYPNNRPEDYQKHIGFCVIKDNETVYTLPSFQPEGIGFGGSESFKFVCEPESTYTLCSFNTEKELNGAFGFCLFQKAGCPEVKVTTGKKWKNTSSIESAWKDENAAGSAMPSAWKNTTYTLSCESEKEVPCYLMLAQKSKDVSAIVFDDNRIVPAKLYIGIYVYTADKKTEIVKSPKWHNSKEVYVKTMVGGKNPSLLVIPCSLHPKEELDYELRVFSDNKVSLKKNK